MDGNSVGSVLSLTYKKVLPYVKRLGKNSPKTLLGGSRRKKKKKPKEKKKPRKKKSCLKKLKKKSSKVKVKTDLFI